MKRILYYLIFLTFFFSQNTSKASHFLGGELTYTATANPNIFNVKFIWLRDCNGISLCGCPPGPINPGCNINLQITGAQGACAGVSYGSVPLFVVPGASGYDIIQLCKTSRTICSNCGTRTFGSVSPGIEIYTFTGQVSFSAIPPSCCVINIGFTECCRNSANLALFQPGGQGYYIYAQINRCGVTNNSSPTFNSPYELVVTTGKDAQIDLSASDPNGDSLSYHLAPGKISSTTNVTYAPNYGVNNPFVYLGFPNQDTLPYGIHLNPITGFLRFRPMGNWVSNLIVEVKKWRTVNGNMTQIGSITRDHQIYSKISVNNPYPIIKVYSQNGNLQSTEPQTTEYLCSGSTFCKTFVATDSLLTDTTDITTSRPSFSLLPNFSITKLYDTTTRTINGPRFDSVKICWTPNVSQISTRPYIFNVTAKDRFCPFEGKTSISLIMYVSSGPTASIKKQVTGLLSRKLTYTRTGGAPNDKSLTYWSLETAPGSNTYTNVNGDSIIYNFPQAGNYKIRLGIITSCSTSIINDSLTVGGFRLMVNEQKSLSCKNSASGKIKLAAVGGNSPYQFKLNNGTFSSIDSFTNLAAGNYWVYARDNNNLRDSLLVTLFEPAIGLSIFIKEKKNVTCFGDSNATINLGVNNALGLPQFKMGNASYQDSSRFLNFKSGTYTFTVLDTAGCTTTSSINFPEPSVLNLVNSLSSRISCKGDSSGSINLSVSGGISPYTYKFDTATSFSSTTLFTGLNAGTRLVQVKDSNNCIRNFNLSITEPAIKLTANITTTQPICSYSKGTVNISAIGGNTPYTYGILNSTNGSNPSIGNLNAGTYTFFVRDSNNCQINFPTTVINSAPINGVTLGFTKKNVFCNAAATGEIKIIGAGGKRPYTYKIDTLSYRTDSIFPNLFAGLKTMYIRDSNACIASDTTTISQPASMIINVSTFSDVSCKGDSNGSVFLSVSGGKTPYTFRVDSGTYQTSPSFLGLKAGNKLFQVRDSNACVKNLSFSISEPANALSSSLVINQPNCNQAKGQAVFSSIGGTPPYLYGIVNGSSSNSSTINNINPGTYTFYVKDDNNCQLLLPNRTILSAPPILNFSFSKKDVFCAGSNTGEIAISGTGGKAPYTFRINTGTYQSDSSFKNLSAGKYRITIRDSVACIFSDSILINQNAPIQINVSNTSKIACKGDSSASIAINASNGNGSYLFSLNNSAFQTSNSFNNLNAGLKNIRVKDSTNCINSINYNITEPVVKLTVSPLVNQAICANDKASIVLNTSGGVQPYSFALNNGTPSSNNNFTNLNPGNYSLMVKDSNNCIINLERTINIPLSNLQTIVLGKDVSCFGLNNGEISISASSGKKPYSFKLNNGNYLNDSTFKNLAAANYSITTKDSFGCITTGTKTINQPTKISTKITATPTSCLGAKNGTATITVTGGKSPFTINWLTNPTQSGTFASNLESGLLRVLVQDSASCLAIDSIDIPYLPTFGDENICAITCDTNLSRYKLVWNKTSNKGIASYQIFRGNTLINTIPFSANPLFVDSSFSLPTNGIAPSYYLKSVDSCGLSSNLSDETKPILMTATVSAGNVNLSWTPYTGTQVPTSYYVYRKIGNGSALAVSQINNGNLNYTDTFSGNQNRSYLIEANFAQSCVSGVRVLSNPLNVFANSIDELNQISREYLLFPNPSSAFVNITNKKGLASVKSLQVTDISGKIIEQMNYEKAQSDIKLDIQHFANGSYFVVLILDNGMKVNLPLQKRL
jgi:hypothetical protein